MNSLSFEIRTAENLYEKLLEDYQKFLRDSTSSSLALNLAISAWHLVDWVYHDLNYVDRLDFKGFQEEIKRKCPSLQIMHDLTNGAKHFHLDRHKPIVGLTGLHKGDFGNDYSSDYDISTLEIELKDGRITLFEDEIKDCVHFWGQFLDRDKPQQI